MVNLLVCPSLSPQFSPIFPFPSWDKWIFQWEEWTMGSCSPLALSNLAASQISTTLGEIQSRITISHTYAMMRRWQSPCHTAFDYRGKKGDGKRLFRPNVSKAFNRITIFDHPIAVKYFLFTRFLWLGLVNHQSQPWLSNRHGEINGAPGGGWSQARTM